MEPSNLTSTLRTQVCVILTDISHDSEKRKIWSANVEDFLRSMHRLNVDITIIGPRPVHKFGSKKNTHYFDRHEVVSIKELLSSKSHSLEIKVIGRKSFSWHRIRTEACVVFGSQGVWGAPFEGWSTPGVITLDSFFRYVNEFKILPGRRFIFQGNSNRLLRAATTALSRSPKSVHVVDPSETAKYWRAHADRFVMKGGKLLTGHSLLRVVADETGKVRLVYLKNTQGTLILDADTVVVDHINEQKMNDPSEWKRGMYYLQRRISPYETYSDDENEFERLDWKELYWRIGRRLEVIDQKPAEGAIKTIKIERKKLISYRKEYPGSIKQFSFSGKILDRTSLQTLMHTGSVPKSFARSKPVATLECAQPVACMACVESCPDDAISKTSLLSLPQLNPEACTGCGACVAVCPSGAAFMIQEVPAQNKARFFFPDLTAEHQQLENKAAHLLNRKDDVLGAAKIISVNSHKDMPNRVVEIESSNVHLWEGRSFKLLHSSMKDEVFESHIAEQSVNRGWVTINGARRMMQIGVPISVALMRIGYNRFEDALFCPDKSCRMCEIKVDGIPALACEIEAKDEMSIEISQRKFSKDNADLSCFCSQVNKKDIANLLIEGATREEACHKLGHGEGVCRGRWCSQNIENCTAEISPLQQPRPRFYGFSGTPWHDIWPREVIWFESD